MGTISGHFGRRTPIGGVTALDLGSARTYDCAMVDSHERDWSFFYWAAVGFLLFFGGVAILSIGGPFLS